jgi:hypothetical protein
MTIARRAERQTDRLAPERTLSGLPYAGMIRIRFDGSLLSRPSLERRPSPLRTMLDLDATAGKLRAAMLRAVE